MPELVLVGLALVLIAYLSIGLGFFARRCRENDQNRFPASHIRFGSKIFWEDVGVGIVMIATWGIFVPLFHYTSGKSTRADRRRALAKK